MCRLHATARRASYINEIFCWLWENLELIIKLQQMQQETFRFMSTFQHFHWHNYVCFFWWHYILLNIIYGLNRNTGWYRDGGTFLGKLLSPTSDPAKAFRLLSCKKASHRFLKARFIGGSIEELPLKTGHSGDSFPLHHRSRQALQTLCLQNRMTGSWNMSQDRSSSGRDDLKAIFSHNVSSPKDYFHF